MSHRASRKTAYFKLRIGPSGIHRRGVFAAEDIPSGRRIIEYTGRRITNGQGMRLKSPHDRYLVRLNEDWLLDGRSGGSGAELINHSCAPNLIFRRAKGRIYFLSLRKIRAGEELTFRYGYPIKVTRVPCHCGAPRCRGVLRYVLE